MGHKTWVVVSLATSGKSCAPTLKSQNRQHMMMPKTNN
ncbi:hypothetical protein Ahy_A06g027692 isoform C [Arachis hypogaea]|uniref:Uncharacterized protein n=1 Tax=Arachis hypogaea TaxID=3818 RepID=A0A445CPG0_ARAHY|nr:hypothetical protein Ahy_A06g027692 isoform C [Arachis hypogaea]